MSDVIEKGILCKRGSGFPYKWQGAYVFQCAFIFVLYICPLAARTFVLTQHTLTYYNGDTKKGCVEITRKSVVENAEYEKHLAFKLTSIVETESSPVVLLMCASSESERDSWMSSLKNAIDIIKSEAGVTICAYQAILPNL